MDQQYMTSQADQFVDMNTITQEYQLPCLDDFHDLGPDANVVKNKRSRLTPRQLAYLEAAFKTNPSPNCKVRTMISQSISMSERSIQIWFQNRRAKIRNSQRKVTMALQEEALRQHYLAAKVDDISGTLSSTKRNSFSSFPNVNQVNNFGLNVAPFNSTPMPNTSQFSPFTSQTPLFDVAASTFNTHASPLGSSVSGFLPCMILAIGTWQRMATDNEALICSYSIESKDLSWVIGSGEVRFRIQFNFSDIQAIELSFPDKLFAEVIFDLKKAPTFATFVNGNWTDCLDFSENQQASSILRHVIKGDAQSLRTNLFSFMSASPEISHLVTIRPTQLNSIPHLNASQLDARRRQSTSLLSYDNAANPLAMESHSNQSVNTGFTLSDMESKDPFGLDRGRSLSLPSLQNTNPSTHNSLFFNDGDFQCPNYLDPVDSFNNLTKV